MAPNVWLAPGPGMHVFLGGPSGVSPGAKYLPDELAREIVTKYDLRKGTTVSKQAIQDHLESVGVSLGLTTDVAMIIRNVYGVQPMFYEDNETLIGELNGVLGESFAMPFREDPPRILSEDDCFRMAIEDVFCEAQTDEDEHMVAYLSTLSLEDVEAIAHLEECLSEDQMEMLEAAYDMGGDYLGEACIDLIARPHMFAFTEESILEGLEAICESNYLEERAILNLGIKAKAGANKPAKGTPGYAEYLKRKFPQAQAVIKGTKKQQRRDAASAELSKRKKAGKDMSPDPFHKDISQRTGGEMKIYHSKSGAPDVGARSQRRQKEMITRSKVARDAAKDAGTHKPLPTAKEKKPGILKRGAAMVQNFRGKVKKWGEAGQEKMKQQKQDRLQTAKVKAMSREGKKPSGVFSKLGKYAKDVASRVGSHVAASARARAPRLTHIALGKEGAGEAEARKVRQGAIAARSTGATSKLPGVKLAAGKQDTANNSAARKINQGAGA